MELHRIASMREPVNLVTKLLDPNVREGLACEYLQLCFFLQIATRDFRYLNYSVGKGDVENAMNLVNIGAPDDFM